jgi:hypothetical protein
MSYSPISVASKWPYLARWALACALCVIATLEPFSAARAQQSRLTLHDVQVTVDEGVYELDAQLDIELPDAARQAVDSGLTLRLTYEIVVDRVRRFWLDAGIASLEQRYEVSYHALSQRYLVRNLNTGEQQDFGTLDAALDRIGVLRGLPVLDTALVQPGPVYEGRIRGVLSLSTAPEVLGWLLFWSDDWSAESDWVTWTPRP